MGPNIKSTKYHITALSYELIYENKSRGLATKNKIKVNCMFVKRGNHKLELIASDGLTNSITNRQMFFIIFLTLTTYTTIDLPKTMAQTAGRSSWIPIIAVSVIFGGAAVIITKLNNMYQEKVLFDYSQEIVGKIFSRLIASYYLPFFLIFGVYLKLKLVGILKSNFLPQTPKFIMLLMAISLFGYVASKGITNVARMFEIIGALFLIVTVGLCATMFLQGMSYNILPFFNITEAKEFIVTMKDLATPFTGLAVLLSYHLLHRTKKLPRSPFLRCYLSDCFMY